MGILPEVAKQMVFEPWIGSLKTLKTGFQDVVYGVQSSIYIRRAVPVDLSIPCISEQLFLEIFPVVDAYFHWGQQIGGQQKSEKASDLKEGRSKF